jgi:hypothetical protein
MDFSESIQQLASKAESMQGQEYTEEATKNALIMPFIQMLGYNVFDLEEVVPEFTADVGKKKGEKVDYAIMQEGRPILLFECKAVDVDLDNDAHTTQLYRYFGATDARFAILTNGIVYRFFSDLEKANIMDKGPFLEFNLLVDRSNSTILDELKKFAKTAFDEQEILSTASQLKYMNEIKQFLDKQLTEPDEDFVKLLTAQVYSGFKTAQVIEEFTQISRRAFRQLIRDYVSAQVQPVLARDALPLDPEEEEVGPLIITTEDEMEAFYIVRAILREVVDVGRVFMRDTQSYCGVLLDDNNRKPICRLHFNRSQKYIGLFDEQKAEIRVPIDSLSDIYNYCDQLRATVAYAEYW